MGIYDGVYNLQHIHQGTANDKKVAVAPGLILQDNELFGAVVGKQIAAARIAACTKSDDVAVVAVGLMVFADKVT